MNSSRRLFLQQTGLALPAAWLGAHAGWLPAQTAEQTAEQTAAQTADASTVPALVVQARAAAATSVIKTMPLRGGMYLLYNSGGNIAVLPGKDGLALVDSGYLTAKPQILDALKAVSNDQLSHLINTHWHFDHTDGNEWMHGSGATILASKKCLDRMSKPQEIAAFHTTFPASPASALPTKTFDQKHTVKLNGTTVTMIPYAPAHTDTDIAVHFVEPDVLHTGDTWFNGFYPFIDYSTGGSIDGMIAAADKTLAMVKAETVIIPGHGKVADKAALIEYREMLAATRAAVAAQKKQGKSLADTVAANPLAAFDAKWGQGFMKPEAYIGLVYQGV